MKVISDVIFCRDVMMLEPGHRFAVLDGTASLFAAGAFLVIGTRHSVNAGRFHTCVLGSFQTSILRSITFAGATGTQPQKRRIEEAGI